MERLGKASAGLVLAGAVMAGGADTPIGEAPGHGSFEVLHNDRYDRLDGLVGCIVDVEKLAQEDVGTQVVPSDECPPDPNAVGQTALGELGNTADTVYARTEAGVAAVAPELPAVRDALEGGKNDLAKNRVRKFGFGLLGIGIFGTLIDRVRSRGNGDGGGHGGGGH